MKHSLFIVYADGREDVYAVAEGQSVLGADPSCQYGIQAEGVADRHLVFALENDGFFVVNLQDAGTVLLNGVPLDGRCRFEFGDELEVGSVRVRLMPLVQDGESLTDTPDGVAGVAEGIRSAGKLGWRGYRRILERTAPFISPTEAEAAERLHQSGLRALVLAIALLACFFLASWWLDGAGRFRDSEICRCVASYAGLFSLLALTVRYRVRYAGRLFSLLFILDLWRIPPDTVWVEYFEQNIAFFRFVFVLLWGWGLDFGAGCVFQKRPFRFLVRYLLLLGCSGMECWKSFHPAIKLLFSPVACVQIPPDSYLPLVVLAGLFPLWGRIVPRKWPDGALDVSFVAEQASLRTGRTWTARVLAILAVTAPLFFILSALGVSERLAWDGNDRELVTDPDGEGGTRIWYWGLRGRYVRISDIDQALIFMLRRDRLAEGSESPLQSLSSAGGGESEDARPEEENGEDPEGLEEKAGEIARELADAGGESDPASFNEAGKELCRQIARVQLAPTNAAYFHELRVALEPCRMSLSGFGEFRSSPRDFLLVYLEETENRRTATSDAEPKMYQAQIMGQTMTRMGMRALSEQEAKAIAARYGCCVAPALVLLCLGLLFLWKRATDSGVGFWLGIALVSNAFGLFISDELGILEAAQYQLWHWACAYSVGSLVTGWFATVQSAGWMFMFLAVCSQIVLFLRLCWPSPRGRQGGWLRRSAVGLGKSFVVGLVSCLFGLALAIALGRFEISLPMPASAWAGALNAVVGLNLLGAWMRRTRRFDTEVPDLGWEFCLGWFFLTLALLPGYMPATMPETLHRVGLFSGVSAVLGGALFLRLCLRRNFLAVMSGTEFSLALFAFSVPVFAEVCESLVEKGFHGAFSFLQSENGVRILSIAVIVVFLAPIWRMLRKLTRRLSMKNLVRVESDVEKTLESLFDVPDTGDVHDEIFKRLGDLGLSRYALFCRTSADGFVLLQKKGWPEHTPGGFRISPYLRHFLGKTRHVIEEEHLALDRELLFQSFELSRLFKRIHATCLLPVCLGNSVRAVIATPEDRDGRHVPHGGAFLENINALGLAAIESMDLPSESPRNAPTRPAPPAPERDPGLSSG